MRLYSPVLCVAFAVLILAGFFSWLILYGAALLLIGVAVLIFSAAKPDNLLSNFILDQMYLLIGLAKRKIFSSENGSRNRSRPIRTSAPPPRTTDQQEYSFSSRRHLICVCSTGTFLSTSSRILT